MDAAKTYATLGFIGAVAIVGIVVGTRPTVMRGHVIAAKLLEGLRAQDDRIERVECEDEIPIRFSGAKFECTLFGGNDSLDVEYEMDRSGTLVGTPLVRGRRKP